MENQISKNNSRNIKYNRISDASRATLIDMVKLESISIKNAAQILKINYSSARNIIKQFNESSKRDSFKKGGSIPYKLSPQILAEIENIVSSFPLYTLQEIKKNIVHRHPNFSISISTIQKGLNKLAITLQQRDLQVERVNDPNYIEMRKLYSLWFIDTYSDDCSSVVFLGESHFNLHLIRRQSRSQRETLENVSSPTIRGRSVSLIASICSTGPLYHKVITNSTVNSENFKAYLNELCIFIRDQSNIKNSCIIFDNTRAHMLSDIEEITNEYNFSFKFLSPYSYMLNPIENTFSKIKNSVRSQLRNGVEGYLSGIISRNMGEITQQDCEEWYRCMFLNIKNCATGLPYIH